MRWHWRAGWGPRRFRPAEIPELDLRIGFDHAAVDRLAAADGSEQIEFGQQHLHDGSVPGSDSPCRVSTNGKELGAFSSPRTQSPAK